MSTFFIEYLRWLFLQILKNVSSLARFNSGFSIVSIICKRYAHSHQLFAPYYLYLWNITDLPFDNGILQ